MKSSSAPRAAPRAPPVASDAVLNAVAELCEILSDNQWRRRTVVLEVARRHKVFHTNLVWWATVLIPRLAESDSGRWFCIVNDQTPLNAPDGT